MPLGAVLPQLDGALFDWTIPAWRETKIHELFTLRLPKGTQRVIGVTPELVTRLAKRLVAFSEPLIPAFGVKCAT